MVRHRGFVGSTLWSCHARRVQVLEFMEHGTVDKVSAFPYTGIHGPPESHNSAGRVIRFLMQLSRIIGAAFLTLLSPSYWRGAWRPGPLQSIIEKFCKGTRICRRYNKIPASTTFRDITAIMDGIRETLKLPYYALTVNFSPGVALALVKPADLMNRDARLGSFTLPPAGSGPPAVMDQCCLYCNNYGRHKFKQ